MLKQYYKVTIFLLGFLFVFSTPVSAETGGLAIAGSSSTLGFGGELSTQVIDNVNARFGVNLFNLNLDGSLSDISYNLDVDLLGYSAMLDWHIFENAFHLTGGVIFNESQIGMSTTPTGSLTIGSTTYTASEIGTISGNLSVEDIVPYIGIGFGNAFGKDKRWGFKTDFGIGFIGSPNIDLSANGTLTSDPAFLAELANEERQIEEDISDFKIFPIFTFCIFYRF